MTSEQTRQRLTNHGGGQAGAFERRPLHSHVLQRAGHRSLVTRHCLSAVALAMLFCTVGCLHHNKGVAPAVPNFPPPAVNPPSTGARSAPAAPIVQGEEGIASWYGHPYHGRRAASGEVYNMYDMTAAHRTLPFGTQVRVHDLENGRDASTIAGRLWRAASLTFPTPQRKAWG